MWDISGTFPLLNATYTARSLIGKLNNPPLEITPSGDIQFVYDTTYRSVFDIGDSLSLTVSDTARTLAVRRLRIPKFDVASSQSLGAIASESGISLPSGNTTLPRFENLRSAPYNFSLEENIRFVSVIEGGIRLVISNNTGVRFENLRFELRDSNQDVSLGITTLSSLNPGQTVRDSVMLPDRIFTGRLSVQLIDGVIPAQSATLNLSAPLTIRLQSTDTIAYRAAEVRYQAQTLIEEGTVRATGGVVEKLRSGTFRRGSLMIRFINPLPLTGRTRLILPTVVRNGQIFDRDTLVPALQTATLVFDDFENWTINTIGDTAIPYRVITNVDPALVFTRVDANVAFTAIYRTMRIAAARAEGVIWRVDENRPLDFNFTLDPLNVDLSLVDTLSGQLFPDVSVDFESSIGFLIRTEPRFITYSARTRDSLELLQNNRPITLDLLPNATTRLQLNAQNSNISPVFTSLPNSIAVRGYAVVNPNRVFGSITDTSRIGVSLKFRLPFRFNLAAFGLRDTITFSLPNLNDVQSAKLTLQIQSGLPINTRLRLVFVDANLRPILVDGTSLQALSLPRRDFATINAAPVNTSGESTALTRSTIELELNNTEFNALRRAQGAFIEVQADTRQGAQAVLARVRASDVLQLRAIVQGTYRIGQSD
ncbi:MAG: hypothetical protein CMR00_03505 [[Chlorobium] sp. 445]|nr:MAG: hypothetical protein CMR00_03505 [[Chlorobium] sp. 445]